MVYLMHASTDHLLTPTCCGSDNELCPNLNMGYINKEELLKMCKKATEKLNSNRKENEHLYSSKCPKISQLPT